MTVLNIARMGDSVLKERAKEIANFDKSELVPFVNDMKETMIHAGGVGLAAPQVSVPLRIVLFYVPGERNQGNEVPLTIMVNPIIKPIGKEISEGLESCLSVPGLAGIVPRWRKIVYSFQDLDGSLHERRAEDFHARVVQHECDHLDGILYPMRMIDLSSLTFIDLMNSDEPNKDSDQADL